MNGYNNKPPISNNLVKKRMQSIMLNAGYDNTAASVLVNLFDYMMKNSFLGGCHVLSSVLYVALCELGLKPKLYIGECIKQGKLPFDHSWISLGGEIIDLAVYMPLDGKINEMSGPVVLGTDVVTMKKTELSYGANTGLPMSAETEMVMNTSFSAYMSGYPRERNGAWTVVKNILSLGGSSDVQELAKKYDDTQRIFVR